MDEIRVQKGTADLINICLGITAIVLRWFLVFTFWGWFIAPVLMLPLITFWQSAGICMTSSLFVLRVTSETIKKESPSDIFTKQCTRIALLLGIWGVGYLVQMIGGG